MIHPVQSGSVIQVIPSCYFPAEGETGTATIIRSVGEAEIKELLLVTYGFWYLVAFSGSDRRGFLHSEDILSLAEAPSQP